LAVILVLDTTFTFVAGMAPVVAPCPCAITTLAPGTNFVPVMVIGLRARQSPCSGINRPSGVPSRAPTTTPLRHRERDGRSCLRLPRSAHRRPFPDPSACPLPRDEGHATGIRHSRAVWYGTEMVSVHRLQPHGPS
jgi:hypothetical protein